MGPMELSLEGAIEQLKDLKEDRKSFLDNDVSSGIVNEHDAIFLKDIEAIDRVLQELDRLQKENEELKNIDLTTVHIKGVCDEKERWKNKIREKIEEIKEEDLELRETDSEGDMVTKCEQRAVLNILQDLLKEE